MIVGMLVTVTALIERYDEQKAVAVLWAFTLVTTAVTTEQKAEVGLTVAGSAKGEAETVASRAAMKGVRRILVARDSTPLVA